MPPQAQEIFLSEKYANEFLDIVKHFKVNPTQQKILSNEIAAVIVGLESTSAMEVNLTKDLGLVQTQLEPLIQQIFQKLINPVLEISGTNNTILPIPNTPSPKTVGAEKPVSQTTNSLENSQITSLAEQVAQFQARKKAREEQEKNLQTKGVTPTFAPPPDNLPTTPQPKIASATPHVDIPQPQKIQPSSTFPQAPKPPAPQATKPSLAAETVPEKPDPYREPLT